MAVTLSLFAGAGAQFLDDSGNVLTGGKIYTYSAGTTTPLATYTSNIGDTYHTNPIILNAAGRISTGEIWLSYGYGYKFVVKDANDVLIGTYDNIPTAALPLIFNDASSISYEQGYVATAGSFIVGQTYLIVSVGTTNFQAIGATSNTVGVLFTATGVGSGTGTAKFSRTVQAKLQESASVLDFGADPTGVLDSTTAIQAAINASSKVYLPAGTYKISASLTITSSNHEFYGAGIDQVIISNIGTDYALQVKSAGGSDPTKLSIYVHDFTIDGTNTGKGLYVYDVAQSNFHRLKVKNSTASGIELAQAVDCGLTDCVTEYNAGNGIFLHESLKAALEYTTNAVMVLRCIGNHNTTAGIRVRGAYQNIIAGGEYSANAYGILLEGGERTVIDGAWVENNTTKALQTSSYTSAFPNTYTANYNKIVNNLFSGSTGIELVTGQGNFFQSNYCGVNITIDAGASYTYIGQQAGTIGTVTDNGTYTTNLYNPAAYYQASGGLKRYQTTIGSTVDITSDLNCIRQRALKGISSTQTYSNNFFGYVDIADTATSAAVTFGTAESDVNYGLVFGSWNVTGSPAAGSHSAYMTARATSGFTLNVDVAPGAGTTVRIFWMLVR